MFFSGRSAAMRWNIWANYYKRRKLPRRIKWFTVYIKCLQIRTTCVPQHFYVSVPTFIYIKEDSASSPLPGELCTAICSEQLEIRQQQYGVRNVFTQPCLGEAENR
ncbi:hypothetical protein ATANTOWER_030155 [Ataeniobius toweri]|uniref:Uncharacterized protein n=1 Tax=Ataeniobius toweri TaxID=208326 RepID=A0ABU7A9D4_9TELE|nr:hypothetical protein [Ataeniobius toweri]